ncbi:hypothetical protein LSAT2_009524 [Lamellibrachia satsuma]|nr:hypothetical protein LSAT2_009524 [Lamellibrachia satsuma]
MIQVHQVAELMSDDDIDGEEEEQDAVASLQVISSSQIQPRGRHTTYECCVHVAQTETIFRERQQWLGVFPSPRTPPSVQSKAAQGSPASNPPCSRNSNRSSSKCQLQKWSFSHREGDLGHVGETPGLRGQPVCGCCLTGTQVGQHHDQDEAPNTWGHK